MHVCEAKLSLCVCLMGADGCISSCFIVEVIKEVLCAICKTIYGGLVGRRTE